MRPLWYLRWGVKAVTPPILLLGAKWIAIGLGLRKREPQGQSPEGLSLQSEAPPEWEYVPEGWQRQAKGWDVDAVARAYREKWPAYLKAIEAPNPLGVHHETAEVRRDDIGAHNMLVSFAYVLALAARGRERISVLDWGGGLGHYHALARSVLPSLVFEYHCKETPAVCAVGREVQPDVTFHEDDSCLERRYDLVVASSSLQYEQRWQALFGRLAEATGRYLYVARVPVSLRHGSFVVLQRAHAYGYGTEYLGWVVDRSELLELGAAGGLDLTRELLLEARFSAFGAPEDPVEHRSFLFNR
jgi:putative methyltransferase (TIGR04325 family)